MPVLIDGELREAGTISCADRGVLHGYGLFETMRAQDGAIPLLEAHLARLEQGAARLGILLPPAFGSLPADLRRLVAATPGAVLRVRLTLTAGPQDGPSVLFATATPASPPAGSWSLALMPGHPGALGPTAGLKTLGYLPMQLAREAARARGHDEALLLDGLGRVIEGAASNLLVVLDEGRVATPALATGPLPGVMRAHALSRLRTRGVTVEERELWPEELLAARGLLVTNAFVGAIAVHRLEDRSFDLAALPTWPLAPWSC